jgi:hypothetical protein
VELSDLFLQVMQIVLISNRHDLGVVVVLYYGGSLASVLGDQDVVLLDEGQLGEELLIGLLELDVLVVEDLHLGVDLLDLFVLVLDLLIQVLSLPQVVPQLVVQGLLLTLQLGHLGSHDGELLMQV